MNKTNGLVRGMAALMLCLAATVPAACAAPSSGGADPQGFTLTDSFLARYQAAELDIAKDPCRLGFFKLMGGDSAGLTLDQAATRYDAQPGVHAMLASHGLTAHDMLTGVGTLMAAAAQDENTRHPGTFEVKGGHRVSEANMAFYRSHKQAMQQYNRQLGQEQLRANGGRLPACLTGAGAGAG
ncbi:hypothetical protein [Dyella sp.]|uniref:hypothetical protein n=1 Tax=Dyella sp. TaxID=1869338 RepID=UPI002ED0E11D